MPIIKSAIKRVRQTAVKTTRNNSRKRLSKELLRDFTELVADNKIADAIKLFPKVQKSLDLLVKNNIVHKNRVSRKKSALSKMISTQKGATVPAAEKKVPAKKAPAKKAAPKKK